MAKGSRNEKIDFFLVVAFVSGKEAASSPSNFDIRSRRRFPFSRATNRKRRGETRSLSFSRRSVSGTQKESGRFPGNSANRGNPYPGFLFLARHAGAENEGSRPNRMETRFLGIAYRKFTEGIGPPVCDLTNELYLTCARIGLVRIAPPADERPVLRRGCRGETKFHKPNLLIPSAIRFRVSSYRLAAADVSNISASNASITFRFIFFFFVPCKMLARGNLAKFISLVAYQRLKNLAVIQASQRKKANKKCSKIKHNTQPTGFRSE